MPIELLALEHAVQANGATAISLAEGFDEPDLRSLRAAKQSILGRNEEERDSTLARIAEVEEACVELQLQASNALDREERIAERQRELDRLYRRLRSIEGAIAKLVRMLALLDAAIELKRREAIAGEATERQRIAREKVERFRDWYKDALESEGRALAEGAWHAAHAATRATDEARRHGATMPSGRDWHDTELARVGMQHVYAAFGAIRAFWPEDFPAEQRTKINQYANPNRAVVAPGPGAADLYSRAAALGMITPRR